ncbi:hypothetical protein [Brevibacillus laterosporus]|uniref:hypothetical protein n=1 Tax=Brevibacillus laterosporus TaxID=1465 RepID=UPI002E216655|nr:hypothetical protein [Brevibacillus laterosporus]MED1667301.1 hypothetical protein [Brevibacillus laterosporus]MED1718238.1 hypothetical protein [Brevibacillus laterosporus]
MTKRKNEFTIVEIPDNKAVHTEREYINNLKWLVAEILEKYNSVLEQTEVN